MKTIYRIVFMLGLLAPIAVLGQNNLMFYHMGNSPQSNELNPAINPDESKIIIGLPLLSGFNVDYFSELSLKKIGKLDGTSYDINIDDLYNRLPQKIGMTQSFTLPLLNFQFRKGDKLFSFSAAQKQLMGFHFDKELINLIGRGNAAYLDNNTFSTNFTLDLQAYQEYALGYSQKVIEGLTVGGRLKLLAGNAAINTRNTNYEIYTKANASEVKLSAYGEFNTNIPLDVEINKNGKLDSLSIPEIDPMGVMISFSNLGFGIDLGAEYKINDKIKVSASVIDLGTIKWKSETNNFVQDGKFNWEGINISNSIDKNDSNYVSFEDKFSNVLDSIESITSLGASDDAFSTSLPTKIYLGGSYAFNEKFSAGIVDRLTFYNSRVMNALTLSGNMQLGKVFSLSAAYSIIGNSYNNLGLGGALKLGPIELFLAVDNIIGTISVGGMQHMNASLGMNLMIGDRNR